MSLLVRSLLARAPTCLLCNGTRVRRSSQRYGRIAGALFVAVRCQECGRRFPLPRRVARTDVTIYSRIPATAAYKQPVEAALREALASVPGTWSVEVRPHADDGRWLVNITRPGGGTIRLSLTPGEAEAGAAYGKVRTALAKEGLVE